MDPQLAERARYVGAGGRSADVQLLRDLFVAQAFGESLQHVSLAWGELSQRSLRFPLALTFAPHAMEQLDDVLALDQARASRDLLQGMLDLLDVGRFVHDRGCTGLDGLRDL